MSTLTIIAVVFVIGYALFSRFDLNQPQPTSQAETETSPEVLEDYTEADDSPSPSPTAKPTSSPKSSSGSSSSTQVTSDSKISISVNSSLDQKSGAETIIYPGAQSKGGNVYETDASGETVYNWYKQEMENKSYQIRNNVKTRANDKFKAVLQGESANGSFKVAIDQENSVAKTQITIN